jgi:hypothetical protein
MDRLESTLMLARQGCQELHSQLDEIVRKELRTLIYKTGERDAIKST